MLGRAAGLSDTGRRRRHNEDAYVVRPPLFAVADGMGGAQAGEIASRLAAAALEEPLSERQDGQARVVSLIQEANRRVHRRSLEDPQASGMGTTMTVALVDESIVWIGHVGDSRAYLLRDGALQQLTDDHSLVAELVRSGKVPAEDAQSHPQRSVITRAVGTDPDVDVDTFPVEPRIGDVFLICSDGLTDMVDDETIREIVAQNTNDLDAAARELVRLANRRGGEDNITVVFFEIADERAEPAAEPVRKPAVAAEDEDTLSELDRVPAVDTAVLSAAEVAEVVAVETRERRARRVAVVAGAIVALLVVLALLLWGLAS
jgi:serine/threonine protein phosphatase PrpC